MNGADAIQDRMLRYDPPAMWQGMIEYYGALSDRPGWGGLHKQFDFVKQLSTSSLAILFQPSLLEDRLLLAAAPIETLPSDIPSIEIEAAADGVVYLTQYARGDSSGRRVACRRVDALHILTRMTHSL